MPHNLNLIELPKNTNNVQVLLETDPDSNAAQAQAHHDIPKPMDPSIPPAPPKGLPPQLTDSPAHDDTEKKSSHHDHHHKKEHHHHHKKEHHHKEHHKEHHSTEHHNKEQLKRDDSAKKLKRENSEKNIKEKLQEKRSEHKAKKEESEKNVVSKVHTTRDAESNTLITSQDSEPVLKKQKSKESDPELAVQPSQKNILEDNDEATNTLTEKEQEDFTYRYYVIQRDPRYLVLSHLPSRCFIYSAIFPFSHLRLFFLFPTSHNF